MTRFSSVDDLLQSIKETKFPYVAIPFIFGNTFPGMIKVVKENDVEYLEIKGEKFLVVGVVPEMLMHIIQVPGN